MVKKSKLLAALDAHKGRDYKLEKQKRLQKQARKRKRSRIAEDAPNAIPEDGVAQSDSEEERLEELDEEWESDESGEALPKVVRLIVIMHWMFRAKVFYVDRHFTS